VGIWAVHCLVMAKVGAKEGESHVLFYWLPILNKALSGDGKGDGLGWSGRFG